MIAGIAVVFGVLTLLAGGRTLFNVATRQQAGNYVAFVLWFNFLAGLAYIVAGVGLWFGQRWAMWLSFAIAGATLLVFAAFGVQIWRGGNYETRTVGAMALRTVTWFVISATVYVKRTDHMHKPSPREDRCEEYPSHGKSN
jgi:hypothetical protein